MKKPKKLPNIGEMARLADAFIDAGRRVSESMKGKSRKEVFDQLKGNLSALADPAVLKVVEEIAKNPPKKGEMKQTLKRQLSNLSEKELSQLADILSNEKKLSQVLRERRLEKRKAGRKDKDKTPPKAAK